MFRLSFMLLGVYLLYFVSNETIDDEKTELQTLQDFAHLIHARAAQLPRAKNKFRAGSVRKQKITTEKPFAPGDAKKYKDKLKSSLDMEFEALELEIKYFLTYLKDLINAKKKESSQLESQEKNEPKTFYDYVHNPPDSVYIFIAVCIIVIFVLFIGIYILYLVYRNFRAKKRSRDLEFDTLREEKGKSKTPGGFSGLKHKLSHIFKRDRKKGRSDRLDGKSQRRETLEDVVKHTSEYDSNSDHDFHTSDFELRDKLLRTSESWELEKRWARGQKSDRN